MKKVRHSSIIKLYHKKYYHLKIFVKILLLKQLKELTEVTINLL